jgi:hypothetical protein
MGSLIFAVALMIAYFWLYPKISSFIPREYDVSSSSLMVTARYYPLTVDGLQVAYIDKGFLIAQGYDICFYKKTNTTSIQRKFLEDYSRINISDTSWYLLPTINNMQGYTTRKFIRPSSNDTIKIQLPALNDSPSFSAYRGSTDTTLIIIYSSNWKRGAEAQLGYIIAWKKSS